MDIQTEVQPATVETEVSDAVRNEQEEKVMRDLLNEERGCLSRVDQEIHHMKSALAGHYKERKTCIGRLDELSLALSPHKGLPSELLAGIFLAVQDGKAVILPPDPKESPWLLRRVCSQWREVAWQERRLWCNLNVEDPESGRIEDVAMTWIPRLWSRTQSFPVSLSLGESSAQNSTALRKVLAPYSHRLRSLSLYAPKESFPSIFVRHSYSFDALESLDLQFRVLDSKRKKLFPTKGQPVTIFTTSTKLRKVTFTGSTFDRAFITEFYTLPWGQLTHLTLHTVVLFSKDLQSILRQCNNLISLTFTSMPTKEDDRDMNPTEILLPHLESMTVVLDGGYCYWRTFDLLQVPSLKEVTFDSASRNKYAYEFDHADLIDMIKFSGSSLKSLSLLCSIRKWTPKALLAELPDLVRLVAPQSRRMPGFIFDMIRQGKILQKLEHLECFAFSPMSSLKLVEHQCTFADPRKHHGISTANISYDAYSNDEKYGRIQKRYDKLKPKLKRRGKDITLKGLTLGTGEYHD